MDNENETPDSESGETDSQETDDVSALKEKYEKLETKYKETSDKNRQLFERAKKAEGFELKDGHWVKLEPKQERAESSNEPDYAKLGYLNSVQVTHPDDQKVVIDEANRLKLPLTDVLQMEHIKNKLQTARQTREAQEGMPSGSNRGGAKGQKEVDYWLAKGGLPQDQELAQKVVNARMQEERGKKFSDEMFNE